MTRPLDLGDLCPGDALNEITGTGVQNKTSSPAEGLMEFGSNLYGENLEFLEEFDMEVEEVQDFDYKSRDCWAGIISNTENLTSNTDRETDIPGGHDEYTVYLQDGRYVKAKCLSSMPNEYFEAGQPCAVVQGNLDDEYFIVPQRFVKPKRILRPFELIEDVYPGTKTSVAAIFLDDPNQETQMLHAIKGVNDGTDITIDLGIGLGRTYEAAGTQGWAQYDIRDGNYSGKWQIVSGGFKLITYVSVFASEIKSGQHGLASVLYSPPDGGRLRSTGHSIQLSNSSAIDFKFGDQVIVQYDRTDGNWYPLSYVTDRAFAIQPITTVTHYDYEGDKTGTDDIVKGAVSLSTTIRHTQLTAANTSLTNLGVVSVKPTSDLDRYTDNWLTLLRNGFYQCAITVTLEDNGVDEEVAGEYPDNDDMFFLHWYMEYELDPAFDYWHEVEEDWWINWWQWGWWGPFGGSHTHEILIPKIPSLLYYAKVIIDSKRLWYPDDEEDPNQWIQIGEMYIPLYVQYGRTLKTQISGLFYFWGDPNYYEPYYHVYLPGSERIRVSIDPYFEAWRGAPTAKIIESGISFEELSINNNQWEY